MRFDMGLIEGFDPEKIIKEALKRGGEFCDIYLEDTFNTSIVCEEDKVEKVVTGRDRGCGIRVISNLKTFYAYTNDLTDKGLVELAGVVSAAVKEGKPTGVIGIQKKEVAPWPEIKKIKRPPGDAGLNEKIALGGKLGREEVRQEGKTGDGRLRGRLQKARNGELRGAMGGRGQDLYNIRLPGRNPGGRRNTDRLRARGRDSWVRDIRRDPAREGGRGGRPKGR
jgi:hypothetical protein